MLSYQIVIDLHTHSTASDGCYSPSELVQLAYEKNLKVLALTDHDTVSGIDEAKAKAKEVGIEFVSGVELNIEWPTGEFHLLGLGLKEISPSLSELIKNQQENRENRNKIIVQKMNEIGVDVTIEQLYEHFETKNLGRPHLAQYLVEKKVVKNRQKAFDIYLAKGRPLYEKKSGCNLDQAIIAIKESGGIPVLAHPMSLYISWGKLEDVLINLHERGIEGLEAYHPGVRLGEAKRLEELALKLGFFVTAGSDFHGEKVRKDRRLGHTAGDIKIEDKYYFEQLLPNLLAQ